MSVLDKTYGGLSGSYWMTIGAIAAVAAGSELLKRVTGSRAVSPVYQLSEEDVRRSSTLKKKDIGKWGFLVNGAWFLYDTEDEARQIKRQVEGSRAKAGRWTESSNWDAIGAFTGFQMAWDSYLKDNVRGRSPWSTKSAARKDASAYFDQLVSQIANYYGVSDAKVKKQVGGKNDWLAMVSEGSW